MAHYENRRGNSQITDYEIETDAVTVWFKGGNPYRYSYNGGAGRHHVEQMKVLARLGSGLSAYITANVRFNYDK